MGVFILISCLTAVSVAIFIALIIYDKTNKRNFYVSEGILVPAIVLILVIVSALLATSIAVIVPAVEDSLGTKALQMEQERIILQTRYDEASSLDNNHVIEETALYESIIKFNKDLIKEKSLCDNKWIGWFYHQSFKNIPLIDVNKTPKP